MSSDDLVNDIEHQRPFTLPFGTIVDDELAVDESFPPSVYRGPFTFSLAFGVSDDLRDCDCDAPIMDGDSASPKSAGTFAWVGGDLAFKSAKPRHFRQPSKSIRACMQPHSVTFCSSHMMFTGWR